MTATRKTYKPDQIVNVKVDQARRFKDLETRNAWLKKLVADLSLDKDMRKLGVAGNF